MSSSRGKNFRRRGGDLDDNEDPAGGTAAGVAAASNSMSKLSTSNKTPSSKPKKPQATKLLSFADDEIDEGEETLTRSKPSSSSRAERSHSSAHKMVPLKERTTAPIRHRLQSNVVPQAGTYTLETLKELQKNTRTLVSSSKSESKSEPVIVLKGLLKPPGLPSEDRGSKFDEKDGGEDMDKGLEDEDKELVPDQAMIDAIRAKRERLRKSRAANPDFISLDSGGSDRGAAGGLSDEEPEFMGRIAMFGERSDGEKKGVFESFDDRSVGPKPKPPLRKEAQTEEEDDEDEEEKKWEEEQCRKGLGKRIDEGSAMGGTAAAAANGSAHTISSNVYNVSQQMPRYPYSVPAVSAGPAPPPSIGGAASSAQDSDNLSMSQKAEHALMKFRENIRRHEESRERSLSSSVKLDENLSASLSNISALEKAFALAGEKYIFMQKLRDYISVICKFLQDKAPYIEELEAQIQENNVKRASTVLERRSSYNDDEMTEIEAAVSAAMVVLRKDSSSAAVAAATNAAQAAVAALKDKANLPVKLDEFGRDSNLQKRMDMVRRAESRKRRRARFDTKRLSSMEIDGPLSKIEGESSTDESDNETEAYQSNRNSLLQTADQIFDNAAEEFAQLSEVKERFEKCKRDYASVYRDAYMSLSVPNIFSPYVRLELLRWDPLHGNSDFLDMNWYSLLFNYGLPEDGNDFAPDDADANLVPELVAKVAVPILHHEIAHCWDILSTSETKNAVSATTLVIDYVPASSEALVELLVAVRTRLSTAVSNLMVPTWSPLVLKAVPNASRVLAYRFGMAVRLMRNICQWKDILAVPVLEKLVIDELLCGKLLPHIRSIVAEIHDAVTRTERIIAALSGVWTGPNTSGDPRRKLQPLVEYVMLLGKNLQKRRLSEGETSGLARRLKKMLVEMNEYDRAREILKTFHLKEAL